MHRLGADVVGDATAEVLADRELFVGSGCSKTTIADIAQRARVSPDTIYATVGRKLGNRKRRVSCRLMLRGEQIAPQIFRLRHLAARSSNASWHCRAVGAMAVTRTTALMPKHPGAFSQAAWRLR